MIIFRIIFFLALFLSGVLFFKCAGPELDDQTVALVKREKITADELLMNYEMLPNLAASKRGEEALKAHLELLIQKKLFVKEGRRLHFHQMPEIQRLVNWFRDEELRKALYRSEIESAAKATEDELLDAFHKGNLQIHVRHLFAKTDQQMQVIQDALSRGISWEEIAQVVFQDSMLANNGGDLGWVSFGGLEPSLEDSAYALKTGEISGPIRTRFGYHLLQVIDARQNLFVNQNEFENQKPRLTREIERRKAKNLSNEFIKNYMGNQKVELYNPTFDLLVSKIRTHVIDSRLAEQNFLPPMKDAELKGLEAGLEAYSNEILITYRDGQWTVDDFFKKLENLPLTRRPSMVSPARFRKDLGDMIRDDFLAAEARRRGLEKDHEVVQEVQNWENEYTFSAFWQSILDTMSVPEARIQAFYQEHQSRYWIPEKVHVQEILVKTLPEAIRLHQQLENGEPFSKLAKKYSLRTTNTDSAGDLGWISSGQMGRISDVAFQLTPGQFSKPIQVAGGFSIIKLLGRRPQRNKTLLEARDQVVNDLRQAMSGEMYQKWVERLKTGVKIQKNDSLLTRLGKEMESDERVVMPGMREIN
ncbi:peptidylprolyl isomerase [candidate division KSB1 bacterium]|nr:peptidylprolyl isomerase [candidate division KSB1 bacterium]